MDGFDWAGDLKRLLGDAAEGIYSSENTPFNEIANHDVIGAIGSPITAFGNAMGIGSEFMKGQVGGLEAAPDTLRNLVGLGDTGTRHTQRLLEDGGGRAIWEQNAKNITESDKLGLLKSPLLIAMELGVDPSTYLGMGVGERAALAAEKAARLGYCLRGRPGDDEGCQPGPRPRLQ
jgi:hypothetical protein